MGLTVEVGWLSTTQQPLWILEDNTYGFLDSTVVLDGFGAELGTTWTDAGTDVLALVTSRGRGTENDEIPVGTATIVLRNDGAKYDPFSTASPYYPGVRRGRPVRIHDGTQSDWVFTGVIDDLTVEYGEKGWSTATLQCIDLMAALGGAAFSAWTPPATELAGARIARVLALAEVAWSEPTELNTGWVTCGTDSISENTNVLSYLQQIAKAELGRLFMAGDGRLRFRDYPSTIGTTSAAVFDNTGTSGIWFTGVTMRSQSDQQVGKVKVTAAGSTNAQVATGTDADSWFTRTLSFEQMPVAGDSIAAQVAALWLNRFMETENRIGGIEVDMAGLNSSQRSTLLGLDLGDVITVKFKPPGAAAAIEQSCVIEQIEHAIDGATHAVRMSLSRSQRWEYWTLEDPTTGALDGNNVLAF